MTPKASQGGRAIGTSFKGVFQYLTHDKRQEGEAVRDTAERVEWIAYQGLITDDPNSAWRIMAATASQQDALKREAGASVAGNKSDKTVFHYSLGWHPDEAAGLNKEEMLRAARESLKALGAEGHQAAFIAHNDTAHPHVHVVVNRVNPENGKMLDLWNYQKRLSKWAMAYEQERGQVYCDKRVENWKRRDLGEAFSADKGQAYHRHDQAKGLGHANDNDTRKIMAEQKAKDAALAKKGEALHTRHSQEWKDLSKWYAIGKAKIAGRDKAGTPTPFQKARAQIDEQYRPLWGKHFAKQRAETQAFQKREKRLLGKLENAVAAVRIDKALAATDKGHAQASLFNFLTSSKARADALERLHAAQTRQLGARKNAATDTALAKIRGDQSKAYKSHRQAFDAKREALKTSQRQEKQELAQQWQERHQERARVADVVRRMETLKSERKATQEPSRDQYAKTFNKAAKPPRQRRGRVRKRSADE